MSPRSGHEPEGGSVRPRSLEQLYLSRTSANRERCDVFERRVECGFEGGGIAVALGKEEALDDEQGGGQSAGVSGSSAVTALVHVT
jgi:hypothetical protein